MLRGVSRQFDVEAPTALKAIAPLALQIAVGTHCFCRLAVRTSAHIAFHVVFSLIGGDRKVLTIRRCAHSPKERPGGPYALRPDHHPRVEESLTGSRAPRRYASAPAHRRDACPADLLRADHRVGQRCASSRRSPCARCQSPFEIVAVLARLTFRRRLVDTGIPMLAADV